MSDESVKFHLARGARQGAPFILVLLPFAIVFGVVATEAGLDLAQTLGMSFLVIAGASQFTAVQLLVDDTPVVIAIVTSLAVNMRMAMYSASLVPYLGAAPLWKRAFVAYFLVDQTGVLTVQDYEDHPKLTVPQRLGFFFGVMIPIAPMWYGGTLFGALMGERIPDSLPIDFAVPITFLAMIAPAIRSRAHLAAAATSVLVALALIGLPYGTGLIIAAIAAMVVGALVETAVERAGHKEGRT